MCHPLLQCRDFVLGLNRPQQLSKCLDIRLVELLARPCFLEEARRDPTHGTRIIDADRIDGEHESLRDQPPLDLLIDGIFLRRAQHRGEADQQMTAFCKQMRLSPLNGRPLHRVLVVVQRRQVEVSNQVDRPVGNRRLSDVALQIGEIGTLEERIGERTDHERIALCIGHAPAATLLDQAVPKRKRLTVRLRPSLLKLITGIRVRHDVGSHECPMRIEDVGRERVEI